MNKSDLFTVIIPCKNEVNRIGSLLHSLMLQTVKPKLIIIADADSIDGTLERVGLYSKQLPIKIIKGGKVGFGRNQGAKLVDTKYIIFIDADMDPCQINLLEETIDLMEEKSLDMSTTNIRNLPSYTDPVLERFTSNFVYRMNNFGQHLSKLINSPFSTGAYMCITKKKFDELGGFDEEITFCEDYWLSKQIHKSKFGIVRKNQIYTSDRRFKKMGYWWMIKNFIASYWHRNNREYFIKDFKYWS